MFPTPVYTDGLSTQSQTLSHSPWATVHYPVANERQNIILFCSLVCLHLKISIQHSRQIDLEGPQLAGLIQRIHHCFKVS